MINMVATNSTVNGKSEPLSRLTGNYHMTLGTNGDFAFGIAHFFENGFMGFWAVGGSGSMTGCGEYQWIDDERFSLSFTGYSTAGGWEDTSGSAKYIGGAFEAYFEDNVTVAGTKIENFNRNLSFDMIEGTYDITDGVSGSVVGILTINSDGSAEGNLFGGCDLNRAAYTSADQFNQLHLELNTSNCSWGSQIIAVGNMGSEDNLVVEATDGWWGLIWVLKK